MPLEFHNRQTPLPFGISILFLTSFFHSVTPINAYPRLCPNNTRQLAYSLETKLLTQWPCWANLATCIKNCQTHCFSPLCFHVLFTKQNSSNSDWKQTENIIETSIIAHCIHFTLYVVYTKVQNLPGVPWKQGTGASFPSFIQQGLRWEYIKFVYDPRGMKDLYSCFINLTRNASVLMYNPCFIGSLL